jgi:CBS domain-containing protein/ribosome-associated translation inhibitor RaiA
MSLVSEIVIEPPILLKPSMRIGEVIPRMSELKIREAPVVDDNEVLVGVLSYRAILSKGVGRDTKVSTAMDPPYALKEDNSIDEAIARIVQWKARDIPIIDDSEKVVGYINRVMLLKYLVDKGIIPNDIVDNVMHSPAITIQEWESIARARWAMLRNGISRLPVVDRYERVVGVITLSDIVERLFRIKLSRRKGYEWIQSEESFLAAPVSDFMSTPAVTVPLGIKLIEAAKTMLDKGVAGAPVVTGDERVVGVLSGIDVLKKYLETSVALQPLEAKISTVGEIDEITRVSVERIINNYLSSFTKYVNVIDFKLAVKELGKSEESRGKDVRRGFEVSARIVTDEGSFAAKSMCWDLPTCVREVMNIIEKRIRKHIEKKTVAKPGHKRTTE